MSDRRRQLMQRFKKIKFVPGHGPDAENMTDDELEKTVDMLESTFRLAWKGKKSNDQEGVAYE